MSARFPRPGLVVVKVGSSSLRREDGRHDVPYARALVGQIVAVRAAGTQVVLVSSGAVAAGLGPLGMARRPSSLPRLQAAASVGQGVLIHTYQEAFGAHGVASGQVLLTPEDLVDRGRYLNARSTLRELLALGAVPVVNENDTVATDELRFGDNDRLSALVASMLGAGLLALLSDVEGLLEHAPVDGVGGPVVPRVEDVAAYDRRSVGGVGSDVGSGGMLSKLDAARIATFSAAHAVIAHARRPGVLGAVVAGADVGTWFTPAVRRPDARKLWIAFARWPRGVVHVDAGAADALRRRGSSLLAAGVTGAGGVFTAGDAVEVVDPDGRVVARGLVAADRDEVLARRGQPTGGRVGAPDADPPRPIIHRDHLVVVG